PFISVTSFGLRWSIGNSSRYLFCSCSKVGFCMFRFARWPRGGRNSACPGPGRRLQFRRDNRRILSKNTRMFRPLLPLLCLFAAAASGAGLPQVVIPNTVVVSVKEQKLMLLQNGSKVAIYPVSTSTYGL